MLTPSESPAAAPHRARAEEAYQRILAALGEIPNLAPELRHRIMFAVIDYGAAKSDASTMYMEEAWSASLDRVFAGGCNA